MIVLKTPSEIALMRESGHIVAQVLAELKLRVKPGVTLLELDAQQKLQDSRIWQSLTTRAPAPILISSTASSRSSALEGRLRRRKLRALLKFRRRRGKPLKNRHLCRLRNISARKAFGRNRRNSFARLQQRPQPIWTQSLPLNWRKRSTGPTLPS